ncbi:putative peptide synthetase protein [Parvularcula bermudensis HTCC2503]|uniref:Putative peptide synthetase protein n=1 Tax=Parvularcula bermudensis (strain ATCC BAA-594 / HTCC2503 / KCTC 12087) TaxID=314260 RepID=E0THA9_PARBH|nr:non-ribosomal peptide synthetase [Parvularcula bermudensis]ADM10199.1 putative peptide synthetase protein [Parvularcula bermudensis HTCC2503]
MSPLTDPVWDRLNATEVKWPPGDVVALFDAQAAAHPTHTAIRFMGTDVSYGEVQRRSCQIALELQPRLSPMEADTPPVVGLAGPRNPDLVAALIGIWRAGAVALPIDLDHPEARRAYLVENSGAAFVVGPADLSPKESDTAASVDGGLSSHRPDFAYLQYTSGSTGKPKGVKGGHPQLANFLHAMASLLSFGADDRLLAVTTLSFDIALLEWFLPLICGGSIILPSDDQAADGEAMVTLLREEAASFFQGTPATWRLLLDAGLGPHSGLTALCGGEPLPSALAATLLPKVGSLWNVYGPTETTVWSTAGRIDTPEAIHVGRPLANTVLSILDEHDRRVPPDTPGELIIGGEGVALGYHARPEETAARFTEAPPDSGLEGKVYLTGDRAVLTSDGVIRLLGRADAQVKIRGFRIELGEVENALGQVTAGGAAAATVHTDGAGEAMLVGYVSAASGRRKPTASTLRRGLRALLPDYMIPQRFVVLDSLPLTPNGKIDRKALPAPGRQISQSRGRPPQTADEQALAAAFQAVLGVETVSTTDNFVTLGGQSLQAARVATRFREATGKVITPRALLFETLEQAAAGATTPGQG